MTPDERFRQDEQTHEGMERLDPLTPGQHRSAEVFAWCAIAMLMWCGAWLAVKLVRWVLDQTVFIP